MFETIVAALARDQFRWPSGAAGRSAVTNITKVVNLRFAIIDDTVRTRLRAISQGGACAPGKPPLQPAAAAKKLASLQKIALAIVIEKFGWQTGANNQVAEGKVLTAIERAGRRIDGDTLKRRLHEAARELQD